MITTRLTGRIEPAKSAARRRALPLFLMLLLALPQPAAAVRLVLSLVSPAQENVETCENEEYNGPHRVTLSDRSDRRLDSPRRSTRSSHDVVRKGGANSAAHSGLPWDKRRDQQGAGVRAVS